MVSVPAGSAVVVKLATPPFNCAVPRTNARIDVVPRRNVTFSPLGGVPPLEETEAVNVTDSP